MRAQLSPKSLSLGLGDSSVPIEAYSSHTYRGWPTHWEQGDQISRPNLYRNAGAAAGLILLATILCEVWLRRLQRRTAPGGNASVTILGLPWTFATILALAATGALLIWHSSVLVPYGPLAVRGWPLHCQAYFRVEAVVTSQAIEAWEDIQEHSDLYSAANTGIAALILGGVVLVAHLYKRRVLRRAITTTSA
jgi:hypothetical protein